MNQDQSQNPQPAEPKIEEAVVVEEPKLADETTKPNLEEKPAPPGEPEIYTVRSEETGDKVYAVRQGKRYCNCIGRKSCSKCCICLFNVWS